MMVAKSNHVLVNMADFGEDLEIEEDVLLAKRSSEDDETPGGESDGTSGTWASTENDPRRLCPRSTDARELTTNQDHRERIIHLRSFS